MSLFTNPFLSLAGQVERLTNVYETEKAVVKNIFSTVGLTKAEKISSVDETSTFGQIAASAANNPKTTALLIAVPASSSARNVVGSSISKLPFIAKASLVVAAPVAIGFVASNPAPAANAVLSTPSGLQNIGTNVGEFAKNPSLATAKKVLYDNPVLVSALGAAGLVGAGIGAASLASTVATFRNTGAVKESNKLLEQANKSLNQGSPLAGMNLPAASSPEPATKPVTRETQVIGSPASSSRSVKRKRSNRESIPAVNVRVNLLNQNNYKSRVAIA